MTAKKVWFYAIAIFLLLVLASNLFGEAVQIQQTNDGMVLVRDADGELLAQFQLQARPVRTTFLMENKKLVFVTQGQQSSLLNLESRTVEAVLPNNVVIGVSPKENHIVTFDTDKILRLSLRQTERLDSIITLDVNIDSRFVPTLATFSPGGRFVAVYYRPGYEWTDESWLTPTPLNLRGAYTKLYNVSQGALVAGFSTSVASRWPLPGRFTVDGQHFVTGSGFVFDLTGLKWSTSEGQEDNR